MTYFATPQPVKNFKAYTIKQSPRVVTTDAAICKCSLKFLIIHSKTTLLKRDSNTGIFL